MYKFFFYVLLLYTIIANITNQGFHSAPSPISPSGRQPLE